MDEPIINAPANGTEAAPQQDTALTAPASAYAPTIWNNDAMLRQAFRAAKYLASSAIVPGQTYRGHPENCLIAIDMANRMNLAPLLVMQNLYIVNGKPGWSGQFCISAINGCGRFSPLEFVIDENDGSCYAKAVNLATGKLCVGTPITWDMVRGEGWLDKSGSKWKTMPQQMFMYRAAAFFARIYCPDVLMGIQTADEIRDVSGDENESKPDVTVITLDD